MSAITDRVRDLLAAAEPFNLLSEEAREDLLKDVRLVYFKPGDVVIAQGETVHKGLYIVESGVVRLMDMAQQRLIRKCTEGDFFGAFNLLQGGMTPYEAKAVEPAMCALVDATRFMQLYEANDELAIFFERDLRRYVRRADDHVDVGGGHLLFNRRLSELPLRAPATCLADDTIQTAARRMTSARVEEVVVMGKKKPLGLLTDTDVRARYAAKGLPPDTPVRRLMSRPIVTIDQEASLFAAMVKMLEYRVSRLLVTERLEGKTRPVAFLNSLDLAHFRGKDPLATVRRIDRQVSVDDLASLREETNEQFQSLHEQGVPPEALGRLIALLYDRVAVRVLELVEEEMKASSKEEVAPWALVRIGSGGREEVALTSPHRSFIVYADPENDEAAEKAKVWFEQLGGRVAEALELCGFKPDDPSVASAEQCRPLRIWRRRYRGWVMQASEEEVGRVLPYFDLRAVYGEAGLVGALKQDIADAFNVAAMDETRDFLGLVTAHQQALSPGRGLLDRLLRPRLRTSETFDLHQQGIMPVVEAARLLALELHYLESTNTFDRLRHAAESLSDLRTPIEAALEGYRHLVDLRLGHQLNLVEGGEQPNEQLTFAELTKLQQQVLKRAASAIAGLQDALASRYAGERKAGRFGGRK